MKSAQSERVVNPNINNDLKLPPIDQHRKTTMQGTRTTAKKPIRNQKTNQVSPSKSVLTEKKTTKLPATDKKNEVKF